MGIEDALREMEQSEAEDRHEAALEGQVKMSVREYAKYKSIQPQLVYYYIRMGYVKEEPCICGRKVIDVASADTYLAEKEAKRRANS